jgi:hypothetical protein
VGTFPQPSTKSRVPEPRQLSYVALRVRGKNNSDACRELGISRNTGIDWEKREWWQSECERERAAFIDGGKIAAFAPLVPASIDTIGSNTSDLDNAWRIIEHVFGKPMQPSVIDARVSHQARAEELLEALDRARAEIDAKRASAG